MMEKGSLHPSSQAHNPDEFVKKVALPNQLPQGLDFRDIPPGLKSSALESLIDQNEDLMARLGVSLRRGSELEERLQAMERENATIRSRFETLKDQLLLIQEKDRVSSSRALQLHEEGATQKTKAERLEKLYTDLFVQAQSLQGRLQKSERARARYRKAAKSLQAKAKTVEPLQGELRRLREEIEIAAESHQSTVKAFELKINGARAEMDTWRAKANERDAIFAERVKLENQLLLEQRQNTRLHEENQDRIAVLESESASLRVQVKETLVKNEAQRQELERLQAEVPQFQAAKQALIEQVESLQALWNHKHKELEIVEEKFRSLQKMNQTLSVAMNQQRKELQTLQVEREQYEFHKDEKIKTLLAEIQMLRRQLVQAEE